MKIEALQNALATLRLIRLRPFDTASDEGRSMERLRRVALTALASMFAKVVSVATALITVPLTLGYLGNERYGLWMTMSSVISILAFADLGIGNGAMNAMANAFGRSDRAAMRQILASGLVMLSFVALVLVTAFAIAYPFIDWMRVFNISTTEVVRDTGAAMAILVFILALNIPAGVIQQTQLALQAGFYNSLWQCAGSIAGLLGVLLVIHLKGGLSWLVLTFAGMPVCANLMNGYCFLRQRPELRWSMADISTLRMKSLANAGAPFFFLQLGVSLAYASDNLIVAHMLSIGEVAEFSVYQKLFSLIPLVLGMALTPLWPVYCEAFARQDIKWIRRTLKRVTFGAFGFSLVGGGALVLLSGTIIDWWVGPAIKVVPLLGLGLALWTVTESTGRSIAMFLNGIGVLWVQLWIVISFVPLCVVLKIYLAGEIGSAGVPIGLAIAYIVIHVPAYYWIVRHWFKEHAVATPPQAGGCVLNAKVAVS